MENETRSFRDRLQDMLATFGASFLWLLTAVVILAVLSVIVPAADELSRPLSVTAHWLASAQAAARSGPAPDPLYGLFLAPWFEEALFRLLPLTLAKRYGNRATVQIVAVSVSGMVFGVLHGGLVHVAIQGVVGYLLARLFLRNSTSSAFTGYLCCVAVHAACNYAVFFGPVLRP